jgi:hypothetical protein
MFREKVRGVTTKQHECTLTGEDLPANGANLCALVSING